MVERIKTLTAMQLKNRKSRKARTKTSVSISIIIQIGVVLAVTFGLYFGLNYLKGLSILPIDDNFFLLMLFLTQAISVIACIFGLTNVLYMEKDNNVIFSFPARPAEVFISKLSVFYITEFKKNLFFLIPFFIAFGIVLKLSFTFYIFVLFMIVLLPFIPVFIGAIISLPLMYIKKLFNKVQVLKIIFSLIVAGLVIWLLIYITSIIPRPLNLLAIYDKFFVFLKDLIISINQYSTLYEIVANMMLGINVFVNILIFLAIIVGLAGITIGIAFLYFKIASQSFETAFKPHKKQKNIVSKNTFIAFVKKELLLNVRNAQTFISHLLYIVSLPVLLYVVNEVISAIDINLNGIAIAFAVNLLIGLMFLTATNSISASAITSEGAEFGLIKTAPSDTSKICYAKLVVNLALSVLGVLFTVIVLAITSKFNALTIIILAITFLLANTAHMFWSIQEDLLHPYLLEYANSGNLRDNKNIGKCVLIGLLISIIVALLGFFCFQGMNLINMLKLPLIAGLFFALRVYLFQINLKTYFNKIQM